MLITTVQLRGETTNDSHMAMHISMSDTEISLARVFQKYISDPTCAHVLIDNGKYSKQDSNQKCKDVEYHIKDNKYVQHKSVKSSCSSTNFHAFSFCVPHEKTHGVRGLSKKYNLQLDPK